MQRLSLDRRSLWQAGGVQILGMLVFVVLAELLAGAIPLDTSSALLLPIGIILALVPAALWIGFFYAQDRREPEPLHFVLGVAVLGGLVAIAVGQPLITSGFATASWIGRDQLTTLLGSILVIGIVQAAMIYATIRFSIAYSTEFDRRVDGVVYGTAAGIGYATAINLLAIFASGGFVDLSAGIVRIVITALEFGAIGGLLGYFIARGRFDDEPAWWMPLGVAIAAIINGLFAWLSGELSRTTIALRPGAVSGYSGWPALALAALLSVIVLGVTYYMLQQLESGEAETPQINANDRTTLLLTIALVIVALAAGYGLKQSVEGRVNRAPAADGVVFAYPDGWRFDTSDAANATLSARDIVSPSYPTSITLRWVPVQAGEDNVAAFKRASRELAIAHARELTMYRPTEDPATIPIRGDVGTALSYAFIANGGALQSRIPAVVLGEDRLLRKGDRVYIFSLQAAEANLSQAYASLDTTIAQTILP